MSSRKYKINLKQFIQSNPQAKISNEPSEIAQDSQQVRRCFSNKSLLGLQVVFNL